jgi:hypothetical protein
MIPAVTEPPRPNGSPTATTQIPDLGVIAGSPSPVGKLLVAIDLEEGDVGLLVAAECWLFS